MWSVIFENRPGREELQGFGFSLGVVTGAVFSLGAALGAVGAAVGVGTGVAVTTGVTAVAWARPDLFQAPYRAWNRLVRAYARRARRAVIAICFFTVLAPVSLAGGRLELEPGPEEESRWRGHTTLPPEQYAGQGRGKGESTDRGNGSYVAWAVRSGHAWMAFLAPFLALVSAFDVRGGIETPDGIYTLY